MSFVVRRPRSRPPARIVVWTKGAELETEGDPPVERSFFARALAHELFRGSCGETYRLLLPEGEGSRALLGLGSASSLDLDRVRRAFGALARSTAVRGPEEWVVSLAEEPLGPLIEDEGIARLVQAIAEGWELGGYSYDEWKTRPSGRKSSPRLVIDPGGLGRGATSAARKGAELAEVVADAVRLTRDLANAPGNELSPDALARRARAAAREVGLICRVLGKGDLEKARMGCILGVAQGSARPPRLIVLEHRPRGRAKATVVLVGKAVTFDAGGISIKPARGMQDMKFDMAGGAAVVGALSAIARLDPAVRVVGIVPAAENVLGASAYRPGDILRSASGKTVEVVNTDAEGRLLLADALWYARRYEPDAVVDIATLTGAMVIALGTHISGFVTTDSELADRLRVASRATGERIWELPLFEEAIRAMESRVADLRNAAGREGSAITAGAFIGRFAEGLSWAHLDIAGTGWTTRASGVDPGGATGVGVRLLVELVRGFAK